MKKYISVNDDPDLIEVIANDFILSQTTYDTRFYDKHEIDTFSLIA